MTSTSTDKSLKNIFNTSVVNEMAGYIAHAYPAFNVRAFTTSLVSQLPALELKARARLITQQLRAFLPQDFKTAVEILINSLRLYPESATEEWGNFKFLPFLNYLEYYGFNDVETSLKTFPIMTRYFSGEFAIRPFLIHHEARTLAMLEACARDDDARVRRLASEGTRPRLPWGQKLPSFIQDPAPALALLNQLYSDENEVVRRSVANHVNDISKDHPNIALSLAQDWLSKTPTAQTKALVFHALRGLRKQGDARASHLLGLAHDVSVDIHTFTVPDSVKLGGLLSFSLCLSAHASLPIPIQYKIHYLLKNGAYSTKVFKLACKILPKDEKLWFHKNHSFKPISTRTYYEGEHRIEIIVAGKTIFIKTFLLQV